MARRKTAIRFTLWTLSFLAALAVSDGRQDRPVIVGQPSSVYAAKNKPHRLQCTYTSQNITATVSWYKDGHKMANQYDNPSSERTLDNGGDLLFLGVRSTDVGQYYCNVTNKFGSTISRNATLRLAVIRSEFRVSPQPTTGVLGSTITLRCQPPRGTPDPQVSWKRNGTLIDVDKEPRLSIEYPPGDLKIKSLIRSDHGSYVCIGRNEAGRKFSDPVIVTLLEAPVFTLAPSDTIVVEGREARLRCRASGDPTPRITWVKKNDFLVGNRSRVLPDNTLVISDIDTSDGGGYGCIANNSGGSAETVAQLTVYTKPVFLQKPISKTVSKGSDVIFRCMFAGHPPPTSTWSRERDGTILLLLYARQNEGRFTVLDDGSLQITNAREADNGEYKCFISNLAGSNEIIVSLRVTDTNVGPAPIITQAPHNVTVGLNHVAELQCKASGNPSPTIRWRHNGVVVLDESRISIHRGNLQITDLIATDGGEYTCLAISASGEASASAYLNIIGARNTVVQTLQPPAPGTPVASAEDVTETSIKIYWAASGGRDQGYYYSVEKFTLANQQGWETANPSTKKTWTVLANLDPGTPYLILVRAHNSYGSSEPSPLSAYIKTKGQAGGGSTPWLPTTIQRHLNSTRVGLRTASIIGSSALNTTWELPNQYRKYVEGFYIKINSLTGAAVPADTIYSSLSSYHIITKLQPYTRYSVTVIPFYHQFSGRPSNLISVVTQEDAPSGPPVDVEVKEGPRYITVSWLPPKLTHRNGVIIGYVIVCSAADRRLSRNFSVNATVMNVALDNLNRDTIYRIGVAAKTQVGTGVVSRMWPIDAKPSVEIEDTTWWKHTVIGALGGLVWVVLCILILCLCRRRRAQKKAKIKTDDDIITVPLETTSNPNGLFVQYQVRHRANMQQHSMSHPHTSHSHHQTPEAMNAKNLLLSYSSSVDYDQQHNIDNYDDSEFKTFYNKSDSMSTGPYATTVILNNMPDRDERMMPRDNPHAAVHDDNIVHGSESSCTDNNAVRPGALSNSSGERSSPPVLPSFAEMLPPPPLYPPPPPGAAVAEHRTTPRSSQPGPAMVGTMPRASSQCHTCHRAYLNNGEQQPRAHFMLDAQGRLYNPTMPHVHSFSSTPYNNSSTSNHEYQTTYPSMPRHVDCKHSYQPYNVCTPHSHSSDSHDYAEPQFECAPDQNLYAGVPPLVHNHPHIHHPHHQARAATHMGHHPLRQPFSDTNSANPRQMLPHQNTMPATHIHSQHEMAALAQPPAGRADRHHSLPSSEHSHELCMSCADQTEYEEPWSDQHLPMLWAAASQPRQQSHQQQTAAASNQAEEEEEQAEETPMLVGQEGSEASTAEERSHGSHTGQSRSGSDDSKSDRQKQRRRQRAQQPPVRSSSPYNGYSTDSSIVFVPRKPYPKSQRRKQMNSKPKSTKSLAVQVEQEEVQQDQV